MSAILSDVRYWFGKPDRPITIRQVIITCIMVIAFVFSNILVCRQIAGPFGLIMAGSTFIYPITYILSDLVSEVYGYRWSRFTSVMALLCNLMVVVIAQLVMIAPVPSQVDVPVEAFATVFAISGRIFIASAIAFLLGDWIDDIIFREMKKRQKNADNKFIIRALVSSAGGTAIDIAIFYGIALTGILPVSVLVSIGLVDFTTKMIYETAFSPINNQLVKYFKRKENLA